MSWSYLGWCSLGMTTVCAIGPVTGWGNSRLDYLWLGIVTGAIGWGLIAFDRRDRA